MSHRGAWFGTTCALMALASASPCAQVTCRAYTALKHYADQIPSTHVDKFTTADARQDLCCAPADTCVTMSCPPQMLALENATTQVCPKMNCATPDASRVCCTPKPFSVGQTIGLYSPEFKQFIHMSPQVHYLDRSGTVSNPEDATTVPSGAKFKVVDAGHGFISLWSTEHKQFVRMPPEQDDLDRSGVVDDPMAIAVPEWAISEVAKFKVVQSWITVSGGDVGIGLWSRANERFVQMPPEWADDIHSQELAKQSRHIGRSPSDTANMGVATSVPPYRPWSSFKAVVVG